MATKTNKKISDTIGECIRGGTPKKQAVAIAYKKAGKSKNGSKGKPKGRAKR